MDRKVTHQLLSRNIPERSSSRSPEKRDFSSVKRVLDLTNERAECNREAKRRRKELKLKLSFDTRYWTARRDIAETEIQATSLTRQISIASMKSVTPDNTKVFLDSEEGQKLSLPGKSLTPDSKLYEYQAEYQAEKMRSQEENISLRRSFVGLFIRAETGWNIKKSRGERDDSQQSDFVAEVKTKMNSRQPEPSGADLYEIAVQDLTTLFGPVRRYLSLYTDLTLQP